MIRVINYEFSLTNDINETSMLKCELEGSLKFNIPLESFYLKMFDENQELKEYCDNFKDYESFTEDLIELDFNFYDEIQDYINQFDELQIKMFSLYC